MVLGGGACSVGHGPQKARPAPAARPGVYGLTVTSLPAVSGTDHRHAAGRSFTSQRLQPTGGCVGLVVAAVRRKRSASICRLFRRCLIWESHPEARPGDRCPGRRRGSYGPRVCAPPPLIRPTLGSDGPPCRTGSDWMDTMALIDRTHQDGPKLYKCRIDHESKSKRIRLPRSVQNT